MTRTTYITHTTYMTRITNITRITQTSHITHHSKHDSNYDRDGYAQCVGVGRLCLGASPQHEGKWMQPWAGGHARESVRVTAVAVKECV